MLLMANKHTREEQVKNYVAEEWFAAYDCKNILFGTWTSASRKNRLNLRSNGGFS